jgi:hypothetical protein
MSNSETILELLRKLGELRSENYEINWEQWESYDDNDDIEERLKASIIEYEEKFADMSGSLDYYEEELDEAKAQALEDVIDGLVQGYVFQHLLQRKRDIETFISSI